MTSNILKLFIEKGFLLDKEMLDFFNELGDEEIANEVINKIAFLSKHKVITKQLVNENIEKLKPIFELNDKKKLVEKYFVNVSISVEVKKEIKLEKDGEIKNNVKIISSPVLVSQKLEVKDFVKHFRNRYNFMKGILQQKKELEGLTSIDKIGNNHRNFSIIGIVSNKNITKNKNIILEVEDLTGKIKLLINQSKEEIFNKAKEILMDDVIGFKCSGTREFVFVNDLFYPDAHLSDKHRVDEDIYAIVTADTHVGSTMFLQKNFERFIDWLNGKNCNEQQKEILKKIRYMFIVGDTVDGVGIYPGQEKFLAIKDMKEQYNKLAEYLDKIPKYIDIIMCPGQHDGVRVAEPQPPVGEDFGEALHKLSNLHLVSNPSLIEIAGKPEKSGIKVFMYHGASMSNIINEVEELRLAKAHKNPARVVKHLLLRRHVSPVHGAAVYIPDAKEDSMLIKEVPDIMVTGDLHKPDVDKYNDILIVCGGCWQSTTPFEEKVGNHPDPCKVPVFNLKTREIKILDFSDAEEDKTCIEKENKIECAASKSKDFDSTQKPGVSDMKK